jgi:hypothetical protein
MNENATGLELKDAASPEALLPDHGLWPWWATAVLLALVIAVVLFLVFKKRRSAAEDPRKVREDAFRKALASLSGIRTDDPRDSSVQCSLALRKYLSVAAADPALFETHEEFICRQDALQALSDAARSAAGSGFSRLAALKYGPEIPGTPAAGVIAESRALLETLHHGFTA